MRGTPKKGIRKLLRGLEKLLLGPLRYGTSDGYDAERYFRDRFDKYGASLLGPGHEGQSERENEQAYAEASSILFDVCDECGVDWSVSRTLEVGLGNGYYTRLLAQRAVKSYLGVDITDALFPLLQEIAPTFTFRKADITSESVEGQFDVVLLIDVIEHIVTREKLDAAISKLAENVAEGGLLLIAPVEEISTRHLFYLASWSQEDVTRPLEGFDCLAASDFRTGRLLALRKRS